MKNAIERSVIPEELTNYIVDITTSYSLYDINGEEEIPYDDDCTLNYLKEFIANIFDDDTEENTQQLYVSSFEEVNERLEGIGYFAEEN